MTHTPPQAPTQLPDSSTPQETPTGFLPEAIPLSTRGESRRLTLVAYAAALAISILLLGAGPVLAALAWILNLGFLAYFIRHMTFAISASRWAETDVATPDIDPHGYTPRVLALVAAHNERAVVDGLALSLLALRYPKSRLRILIVDDASTDGTGQRLDQWHTEHPRIETYHRPAGAGGGKSGALNDGLHWATHTSIPGAEPEIVVIFDADHEPEPSSLLRVVRHFRDEKVGAVMGRCVIRNAKETRISSTVFVDYLSGYLVNEYGRQAVYELPAYGGANCAVRADVLKHIGGFNPMSVTEDTDLTLRILAGGGKVRYDPAAVDFEEAAKTAQTFWKQRYRWARGHQKCARDYWKPTLLSRNLKPAQKMETLGFLLVYHAPLWVTLGMILTMLRAFGIGDEPAALYLPLGMLLFIGPLTELAVGLLIGRTERNAAWSMLLFVPMFAITALLVTWAWIGGMLGLKYSWSKTKRSGTITTHGKTNTGTPEAWEQAHSEEKPTEAPKLPELRKTTETNQQNLIIRTGARPRTSGGAHTPAEN